MVLYTNIAYDFPVRQVSLNSNAELLCDLLFVIDLNRSYKYGECL